MSNFVICALSIEYCSSVLYLPVCVCVRLCTAVCVTSDETEKSMVLMAMRHLEDLTCITFREVNASDPLSPILDFKKDQG